MHRRLPIILVVLLIASGCRLGGVLDADPVIDTWPVGEQLGCDELPDCDELIRVGLAGLADRDPEHAPVVSTHLHREGVIIDPATGHQILYNRSGGCCQVLVVDLMDGTTRAIGVGYPGVSDTPIAIPWEVPPGG